MAISNLVSPGKKIDIPGVSTFFGTQQRSANDNVQKVSSTMLSDSMVSSVIETLKVFTSEIGRLKETSKNIVRSFVGLIKSFKNLNRDISLRFKTLSTEINASRLDFVRNVMAVGAVGGAAGSGALSLEDKFPPLPGEPPKPTPEKNDSRFDFIDALAGLLGIGSLAKGAVKGAATTTTMLARGLGMAITNPIVAGILGASGAFASAVFASAAIGDWLERKFGIKEKIKAREGTEEYKELQETQKQAAETAQNKSVGDVKKQRNESITEFLKSKGLGGPEGTPRANEIRKIGDNVTIIAEGHKDKGKTFNFKTGEEVNPSTGMPVPAPAAPPAAASSAVTSAPDTASSAAMGVGEGGADLNVVPAGERVGSPTPAPAPTAAPQSTQESTIPKTLPAQLLTGGAGGAPIGGPARAETPPASAPAQAPSGSPAPAQAPSGSPAPAQAPSGSPAPAVGGVSPSGEKTFAQYLQESNNDPILATQRRNMDRIARKSNQPAAREMEPQGAPAGTPAAATAPTTPEAPPATPAPSADGGGAPVVINNNSTQASESASNTEGNNVAGQNFPMFVTDPFMQQYIQRVTPHYQ